jgi:hypothetical protein
MVTFFSFSVLFSTAVLTSAFLSSWESAVKLMQVNSIVVIINLIEACTLFPFFAG